MKISTPLPLQLILLSLFCIHAGKAIAEDNLPGIVEIEARFVRASDEQLRAAFGIPENQAVAIPNLPPGEAEKALGILGKEKADFFSSPRLVTNSGQHAVVESIRELRYAVDYVPSKDEPGKSIPTEFETRNAGVTLEVEPVVRDEVIDLKLRASVISFLGFIDFSDAKPTAPTGEKDALSNLLRLPLKEGGIWQPVFSTQQIATTVSVRSGETLLLGELPKVLSSVEGSVPTKDEGEPDRYRTLVFITARVLKSK